MAKFAWQGLVILSTIPIGGHYVIDLMAGSVCWAAAHMFWRAVADRATMASSLEEASPAFA
ncbi:MAG TPA: hypothetical protein VFK19_08400 [Sphingomicrobium sp.]|nr:hypothetical protein [Sphingomicrobium sp.]